ncbi:MAG: nitronate monooxygenase [Thermomicrobiales bacterium]
MWPTNELTERLGLDWPIIQAPMAGSTTPELAAAVSNAGGLGSLGLGTIPAGEAGAQMAAFAELSEGPLNANFFCHEHPVDVDMTGREMRARLQRWYFEAGLGEVPYPTIPWGTFGHEQVEQILAHRPAVVSFHFGLPDDDLVDAVRAAGCLIISSATTVAEARWLEERGADAVIAQGIEAGGHRGTFLDADPSEQPGLFSLLPQVVSAVDLPVIAAGGIADGRAIAAAFVLGASAVQMGTAFLRCPEATVHPAHRQALASAGERRTRQTKLFSGKPARAFVNRFMESFQEVEELVAPYPSQASLFGPIARTTPEDEAGDVIPMWAGQSAVLTREMPAADLVATLADETSERLREIGR